MILLDTDVCIELLRGNFSIIKKRESVEKRICIAFMTVAELYYGAEKSLHVDKSKSLVESFLLSVKIINTDLEILKKFGELKNMLVSKGKTLPDADLFIAATSLTYCDKLITGNVKHFQRIDKLKIENWIR